VALRVPGPHRLADVGMAGGRGDQLGGQAWRRPAAVMTGHAQPVEAVGQRGGELGQVAAQVAGVRDGDLTQHLRADRDGQVILGRPPPVQRRLGHPGPLGHVVDVQRRVPARVQQAPARAQHPPVHPAVPRPSPPGRCRLAHPR
jgi:hypothetical protein